MSDQTNLQFVKLMVLFGFYEIQYNTEPYGE